jgi:hypothetical protein
MAADTDIVSFVVRFVCEGMLATAPGDDDRPAARAALSWHGTIRHVQSNTERRFVRWEDAVAFIERYIDIGQGHGG